MFCSCLNCTASCKRIVDDLEGLDDDEASVGREVVLCCREQEWCGVGSLQGKPDHKKGRGESLRASRSPAPVRAWHASANQNPASSLRSITDDEIEETLME